MANNNILEIKDLSLSFGGLKAVSHLSFNVSKGEIVALIGPNGAGKTTVFNCVTRFYTHYTGQITYYDEKNVMHNLSDHSVTDIVKLGIARTFQNIELIPDLSIIDNVIVGAHKFIKTSVFEHVIKTPRMIKQEKELYAKALSILEFLNIDKIKDAYVMGLPYGILKKVELARALITDPSLLILDEPAAGLNDLETEELSNIVLKLKNERHMTVLLIEHDMRFVMNMSDHVCAISFGKFLAYDKPNQIKNNIDVQEAYLGKDE